MQTPQRTSSPQTQTQTQTQTQQEHPRLVLRPPRSSNRRQVHWSEEVCDNENLNRKSSKVCCIYHPPTEFGESSDDSSDPDSDSETDSEAEEEKFQHCCKEHNHAISRPNAYERQPKRRAPK